VKIAALSDIHGNLFALDAVLEDVRRRGVDITLNLGDILSGALLPAETADRLMELDLPTIRGNHERQVLTLDPQRMGASDRHAFDTLGEAHRAWIAQLPAVLRPAEGVFM
jgi:predicted phosphodiesterase